ncbi:MAG: GNAT family N-acetyltransferase [Methanocella sp.]
MTARIIDDRAAWDNFVDESPYSLLFHKWDFLKIMEKYSGMELLPYGIFKGDELICQFPFFFKKGPVKLMYSPPMTIMTYVHQLGFIMSQAYMEFKQHKKERCLEIVAQDIAGEIARLTPNFVSIYAPQGFMDVRPFLWAGFSLRQQYNYIIDLEESLDTISDGFDKPLRRNLRALERSGSLKIEQRNDADLLFDIMRKKLAPYGQTFYHYQSPEYMKELMAAFPDNIKMYQLFENDELVTTDVMIEHKGRAIFWGGGAGLKEGYYTAYLKWENMKKAKARGFKTFEIWGADVKREMSFKSKFNPRLEYIQIIQKKDMIGDMMGRAFYAAMKMPVVKNIIKI